MTPFSSGQFTLIFNFSSASILHVIFLSYMILLFSTVYFIRLIFYIFERGLNVDVKTYGDAI